jgi:hypothetical protein
MGLPHKARQAPPKSTAVYVRHRPETTLLYQIIQEYWPEFQAELTNHGKHLPAYVKYPKCGRLEHGFLRVVQFITLPLRNTHATFNFQTIFIVPVYSCLSA